MNRNRHTGKVKEEKKENVYLTIVHKATDVTVHNTTFKLNPQDECYGVFVTVRSTLKLNMKRILLLNERGILKIRNTVQGSGLMEDNTVYVVETINDQKHVGWMPVSSGLGMALFIKQLDGTVFELAVFPNDTIQEVKENIQKKIGMPTCHQRLISEGRQLEDGRTLSDYDIRKAYSLWIIERVKGN